MEILTVPIAELKEDPNNVNKHGKLNMDAITGSLTAFGQQKPIVINEHNIIIAGNGTYRGAKALKWKEIKCVRSNLSSVEQTAYAIADNQSGKLAEWDDVALDATLESLQVMDFDVGFMGFEDFGAPEIEDDEKKTKTIEGSKELDEDDFNKFDNECPKCGFEWDNKK